MASYLQDCGIFMGRRMAQPGPGNPRGHFEDRDFLDLNKAMLADNGCGPFSVRKHLDVSVARKEQGRKLVAARTTEFDDWGWKDPRSALFLDFWHELAPDAKYVFLYREPVLMLDSLFRRPGDRTLNLLFWRAGMAWLRYNRDALNFGEKHPTSCIFINIGAFNAAPEKGQRVLGHFLGRPLTEPYSNVYEPGAIRESRDRPVHVLASLNMAVLGKQLSNVFNSLESRSPISGQGSHREF